MLPGLTMRDIQATESRRRELLVAAEQFRLVAGVEPPRRRLSVVLPSTVAVRFVAAAIGRRLTIGAARRAPA